MSCSLKTLPTSFGFGYNRGYQGGYQGVSGGKFITIFIVLLGIIAYTSYSINMINKDDQSELENKNIPILSAACAVIFTLIFSYTIGKDLSLGIIAILIIAYSSYTIDKVKNNEVSELKTTTIWLLSLSCIFAACMIGLAFFNPGILRW